MFERKLYKKLLDTFESCEKINAEIEKVFGDNGDGIVTTLNQFAGVMKDRTMDENFENVFVILKEYVSKTIEDSFFTGILAGLIASQNLKDVSNEEIKEIAKDIKHADFEIKKSYTSDELLTAVKRWGLDDPRTKIIIAIFEKDKK